VLSWLAWLALWNPNGKDKQGNAMGNRLSRISTRTGDDGTTGLGDGARVEKDSPRIDAIGDVDELNSVIGVLLCENLPGEVRSALVEIQHDLFDLGGELSIPGYTRIGQDQVARLDRLIEQHNASLPRLAEFILPGGTRAASAAHIARTVCRRAERALVALGRVETINASTRQYVNRLSDFLFVAGRYANDKGARDVLWAPGQNR